MVPWLLQHLTASVYVVAGLVMVALFVGALVRALRPRTSIVSKVDLDSPRVDVFEERTPVVAFPPMLPKDTQIHDSQVQRAPRQVTEDDVTFLQLEPEHLSTLRIVAQALDNQWQSRAVLDSMESRFEQGLQLGLAEIRSERYTQGRSEYMRALLNAEQVVVNRVFFYNTDYLAEDYIQRGPQRDALKQLLTAGVLVPYLFKEHSPAEPPVDVAVTSAHQAWNDLCREAVVQAMRLSWDDTVNERQARQLSGSFAIWLNNLGIFNQFADVHQLARELMLPTGEDAARALERRFAEVARWAQEQAQAGKTVMRGGFYQEFVLMDESPVELGIIDFDRSRKPFAKELKQIADLSYATNLPDALGGYALTPMDSLPRTALQELTFTSGRALERITDDQIKELLQRQVFSLISGGLYLKSLSRLTLHDVIALRATSEWAQYIMAMKQLLDNPLSFQEHAQVVYDRYIALAERMTERAAQSGGRAALEQWMPVIEMALTIGSSVVSFLWYPTTSLEADGKVLFSVTEGAITRGATLTARMLIRGRVERRTEAELETSLDFMRRRLENAQGTFGELVAWLRASDQASRFREISGQRAATQDALDPNINTPD